MIYKEAVENGWFWMDPFDYERFDMSEPVLKCPDLGAAEIIGFRNKFYRTYFSPGYIYHRLKKIRTLDDIFYNFRGIKAVFGHIYDFL